MAHDEKDKDHRPLIVDECDAEAAEETLSRSPSGYGTAIHDDGTSMSVFNLSAGVLILIS
jgi:hypothetical protein